MHVFKYHAVANHVQDYYVSIKMNCHIKSVVLGEGKRRMWMESRWLWKRRLRHQGAHWDAQQMTEVTVKRTERGNHPSQKQLYGHPHPWNGEVEMMDTSVKYRRIISEPSNSWVFHNTQEKVARETSWLGSQLIWLWTAFLGWCKQ